jgi:hypothetical protein
MLLEAAAACIALAASSEKLPPAILVSILAVEGGRAGTRSHDDNGTDDLGPAQINTVWLDEVARAAGLSRAEAEHRLQWDGCFNVRVAAAILRHEVAAAGGDFWTGVGHYHSHDPAESLNYQRKIVAALRRLFGSQVFARG